MNESKLEEMPYSLVFVVPKQQFFAWLKQNLQNSGRQFEGFYFEEEDLTCLIPAIHTFGSQEKLTVFLTGLKVNLLKRILGEIGTIKADCPELTTDTFDEFFDLKIRDKVWVAV